MRLSERINGLKTESLIESLNEAVINEARNPENDDINRLLLNPMKNKDVLEKLGYQVNQNGTIQTVINPETNRAIVVNGDNISISDTASTGENQALQSGNQKQDFDYKNYLDSKSEDTTEKPNLVTQYKDAKSKLADRDSKLADLDAQKEKVKSDADAAQRTKNDIDYKLRKSKENKAYKDALDNDGQLDGRTRLIDTGLTSDRDEEVLDSVIGQLSDGIWENSPAMNKFWLFANVEKVGDKVCLKINDGGTEWNRHYMYSGFANMTNDEIKAWFARKVKQIAKTEMGDGSNAKWDRNDETVLDYLDRSNGNNISVKDAYRVYDKLLGRKDRIPESEDLEEDDASKYNAKSKKDFSKDDWESAIEDDADTIEYVLESLKHKLNTVESIEIISKYLPSILESINNLK